MVDLFRLYARYVRIRMGCPTATSTPLFTYQQAGDLQLPLPMRRSCTSSTYNRTNHDNLHVHGYFEKGNMNTPLELAIVNQVDRFSLAIDVIDRVPFLRSRGSHAREALLDKQLECRDHAHTEGINSPRSSNWKWPL